MKKITIFTRQVVYQTWEYELEVEDDFNPRSPGAKQEVLDKIYNEGIEGHLLSDDNVVSEEVLDFEWS